jgi:hypothetical protein
MTWFKQKQDGLGNTDKYDQKQIVNVFNIMEEWDQLFFKPFEKVAFLYSTFGYYVILKRRMIIIT